MTFLSRIMKTKYLIYYRFSLSFFNDIFRLFDIISRTLMLSIEYTEYHVMRFLMLHSKLLLLINLWKI